MGFWGKKGLEGKGKVWVFVGFYVLFWEKEGGGFRDLEILDWLQRRRGSRGGLRLGKRVIII